MQGWTSTTKHGVTRKRSTKRLKYTGKSVNSKLEGYLCYKTIFCHKVALDV